jgi:glycosyltransferase involved in cell wall biosynthesis
MVEVSVILPCRDEEKTVGRCIQAIKTEFKKYNIDGEIIVSDSSSDDSLKIAKKAKVATVFHNKVGYGIACLEGIKKAKGKVIVFGDADYTYDFSQLHLLIKKIDDGYDLVIGSRLKGRIKKGAMPFSHRYVGNPVLSFLLNLFFRTHVSDAHSGLRAIRKKELLLLDLKTTGMEFASEMIIKSAKNKLKIGEVPITYSPRIGKSKLKSVSDGWRHLRFMLLFSPTYLFLIPGSIIFFSGLLLLIMMQLGAFIISGKDISTYVVIIGSLLSILGYQIISLGLYSRIYAIHTGFEKEDKLIDFIAERITLERGLVIGFFILVFGIANLALNNSIWPNMLLGLTILIISLQTIFSAFFISMMLVERRE